VTDRSRTSPLASVVVPFFNSERHLAACIESLIGQTGVGGRYEIILVDNGSRDDSAAIAARYDGVTVLREETRGAYAARNTGIAAAAGPIIALTDADCVVEPGWLRSIIDAMDDPQTAILVGYFRYPPESTLALKLLSGYENAKTEYVVHRCPKAHHFAFANNMAVRASVFDELGPFLEWRRAADTELVHRLARRRPDLGLGYNPAMRMTHLEFTNARSRARRLSLYTETNTRIDSFRELTARQRIGVLLHWLLGGGR
jgi:glycosyltransferase involved in cell wall biosynthesis